jgi:hypothetical protein
MPAWMGAIAGAMLSAVIEIGQPLFNEHRCSTSDVILGAAGAWVGAMIAMRVAVAVKT